MEKKPLSCIGSGLGQLPDWYVCSSTEFSGNSRCSPFSRSTPPWNFLEHVSTEAIPVTRDWRPGLHVAQCLCWNGRGNQHLDPVHWGVLGFMLLCLVLQSVLSSLRVFQAWLTPSAFFLVCLAEQDWSCGFRRTAGLTCLAAAGGSPILGWHCVPASGQPEWAGDRSALSCSRQNPHGHWWCHSHKQDQGQVWFARPAFSGSYNWSFFLNFFFTMALWWLLSSKWHCE